jgi:lysocardiolipin and lysophospholipid acyltransferase
MAGVCAPASGEENCARLPSLKERALGGVTAPRKSPRAHALSRREYVSFYARLAGLLLLSFVICVILASLFPLMLFHRKRWRVLIDHFQALWVNGLLWMLPPQTLELSGELPDASMRPKVVIANHQTDVDWVYLWMIARSCNLGLTDRSGAVKIMLKREVQLIPFVGWGCTLFDFIFLKRDWAVDAKRIESKLATFCRDEQPLWIFLFVEGTTINVASVVKSNDHARAHGRPSLNLLVLPRVRGLHHVLNVLRSNCALAPEIFDMTMAYDGYSGEVPTWEMGFSRKVDTLVPNFSKLMMGTSCRTTHIDSRRFCLRELARAWAPELDALAPHERDAAEERALERWVDQRWCRKERLMQAFAERGAFPEHDCGAPVRVQVTGSIFNSLAAVLFYLCMYFGVAFTYFKYAQDGAAFFRMLEKEVSERIGVAELY